MDLANHLVDVMRQAGNIPSKHLPRVLDVLRQAQCKRGQVEDGHPNLPSAVLNHARNHAASSYRGDLTGSGASNWRLCRRGALFLIVLKTG